MAIGITAKGSASNKTSATTLTISSVTIAANCWIVVGVSYSATFTSIVWNGNTLTADLTNAGVTPSTRIYSFFSSAGGTGDLVFTVGGTVNYKAMTAYEISGLVTSSAADKTSANNATSTSPTSNATATLTQASEIFVGVIGINGPSGDAAGSWSNSFTDDGQRSGTTGGMAATNITITGGWLIVSSTTGQAAAKTGITSRAWNALVVSYKGAATRQPFPTSVGHPFIV